MTAPTIFLLSPANCGGKRAELLLRPGADFELAARFRSAGGAPLGEVFAFLSGLYFRGKLAYASRFAAPPHPLPGAVVITTNRGLVTPETPIGPAELRAFAGTPIDLRDPRYREPLEQGVARLAGSAPPGCTFVLLGSIATAKYVELLLSHLGERLCFPRPFVGMGDMQRGALMLRAVEAGEELPYIQAAGAVRSLATRAPRAPR